MMILWVVVPVALAFVAAAIVAYVRAARAGQFDDLETPAIRMLFDDDGAPAGVPPQQRSPGPGRAEPKRG
ncbi:MAG: cbb3-type cytochrome oxidase assembly protein CcoS [Planctomycetes bacterium]|nr:cbb3-type cytochrome oxidase assembly protein CcoS [Planctomycetota bacterium]